MGEKKKEIKEYIFSFSLSRSYWCFLFDSGNVFVFLYFIYIFFLHIANNFVSIILIITVAGKCGYYRLDHYHYHHCCYKYFTIFVINCNFYRFIVILSSLMLDFFIENDNEDGIIIMMMITMVIRMIMIKK